MNKLKYIGYKPAWGGGGTALIPYVRYIKYGTTLQVKNVFEIGANFAQDADLLMECFGLAPSDIYVFEARHNYIR